jgi:hypothetical protein
MYGASSGGAVFPSYQTIPDMQRDAKHRWPSARFVQ